MSRMFAALAVALMLSMGIPLANPNEHHTPDAPLSTETLASDLAEVRRELADMKTRLSDLEGETLQMRDTLSVRQEPRSAKQEHAAAKTDLDPSDRSATVELIAQDIVSLRGEIANLKARLARAPAASMAMQSRQSHDAADVLVTGSISAPRDASAAASPTPPGPLGAAAAEAWLIRGDELLRIGDVSGARLVLDRALRSGNALAAFKLAETYDRKRLSEWRVVGVKPDPAKARELYERAHASGIEKARERLANIQ
jgi:TPR repeat protein